MRRVRLGLIVACITVGVASSVVSPPAVSRAAPGAGPIRGAVHWSLDEPGKRIIVEVKIQLFNEGVCTTSTSVPSGVDCQGSGAPSASLVSRIVDAIHRYWDGHRYKCWDVVVRVQADPISGPDAADQNAVEIALIDTPVHVTPYVLGTGGGHYLSTDPADRVVPSRQFGDLTAEWPTRGTAPDHVYAHEFGHILGLDDNYGDSGQLLPNAAADLMWAQSPTSLFVSEDMISRAVLRSGLPVDRIRCPMTADGGPSHLNLFLASLDITKVHLYTCDYDPSTTDPKRKPKPMAWKGTIEFGGSYLAQIGPALGLPGGSGSTSVSPSFSATVPANAPGVLEVPFVPGEGMEIPVAWQADGLLHATDAVRLNAGGQTLSTASFFPGPPLLMSFKDGAAECPP